MINELPKNTIMLCEVGSTAHGTGLPGKEDHDEMGIVVESLNEVLSVERPMGSYMERTKPEGERSGPGDTDRTLHSLRRFLNLALSGNPSILLCLWSPVLQATPYGDSLRLNRTSFSGRHVIPRYRGYMQAQAGRLLGTKVSGHGRRGGGGREELIEEHGYDTKYAMHCARLGFQGVELVTTGNLSLPMKGETGDWLRSLRHGNVPFKEWFDVCLNLDMELQSLEQNDSYPSHPEFDLINELSATIHKNVWEKGVANY